jgi:hypothetical protein
MPCFLAREIKVSQFLRPSGLSWRYFVEYLIYAQGLPQAVQDVLDHPAQAEVAILLIKIGKKGALPRVLGSEDVAAYGD